MSIMTPSLPARAGMPATVLAVMPAVGRDRVARPLPVFVVWRLEAALQRLRRLPDTPCQCCGPMSSASPGWQSESSRLRMC
jgi:hypothetical protein